MTTPSLSIYRGYFFVVSLFTTWVGFFGFFRPQEILRALPWPVPPLHARFIGAIYLGATVFLLLSLLSRSRLATRTIVRIACWWTGWLLIVTFIHWASFDFDRVQTWFWVVAYIVFPLFAAWLAWAPPDVDPPRATWIEERWVLVAWRILGGALILLAIAVFVVPGRVGAIWPWKISPFLAQIYSGPLLGLGLGFWTLAARRNWTEARIPLVGLLVAAVMSIVGSLRHLALFTPGSVSLYVWFTTLGLLVVFAGLLSVKAWRAPGAEESWS